MVSYKDYLEKVPALKSKMETSYQNLLSVIYGEDNAITQGGSGNSLNDNDLEFLFQEVYQVVVITSTALNAQTARNMLSVYQRFFKEGNLTSEKIIEIDNELNSNKVRVAVFCGLPKEIKNVDGETPLVVAPPTDVVFDVETRTIDPEKLIGEPIEYTPSGTTSTEYASANWTIEYGKGEVHVNGNLWGCVGTFNTDGTLISWETPFMITDDKIQETKAMYDYMNMNLDFKLMFSSYLAYRISSQTW